MMMPRFVAPEGDVPDQVQGDGPVIGELDGSLAETVIRQPVPEMLDGNVSRVDSHMVLEGSKMDDILIFPIGGHPPGNPFLRFRQGRPKGLPNLMENGLDVFPLIGNVLVDGLRHGWFTSFPALFRAGKIVKVFRYSIINLEQGDYKQEYGKAFLRITISFREPF